MEGTSSNKVKLTILKKYSDDAFIVKVLKYTYNWYKKYGVHVRVLKKHARQNRWKYSDFQECLRQARDFMWLPMRRRLRILSV